MERVKPGEVQVGAVQDVEGSWFECDLIEHVDVVDFGVGDEDDGGDVALQIEQGMKLDSAFVLSELCPGEEGKTQIDDGRVQGVEGLIELCCKGFLGVELSGLADEELGEIGVNLPGAHLIGMGESVARDPAADAHVVEFLLGGSEADLDVSEAFAISKLRKGQAKKLVPA